MYLRFSLQYSNNVLIYLNVYMLTIVYSHYAVGYIFICVCFISSYIYVYLPIYMHMYVTKMLFIIHVQPLDGDYIWQ